MKALTLTQPWASLVASGAKRIETRSWRTSYRGPLAIHAAAGMPKSARELRHRYPFAEALMQGGISETSEMPLGKIVATCRLIDCVPTAGIRWGELQRNGVIVAPDIERVFGEYAPGRWAWLLADIRRIDAPIPAKGSLSLWEWVESSTAVETLTIVHSII